MKAANAATILRSMRGRADLSAGVVQMGKWEEIALCIALAVTESDMTPDWFAVSAGPMNLVMLRVDQTWYELIRKAYKALDLLPSDKEYSITDETIKAIFTGEKGEKGEKSEKTDTPAEQKEKVDPLPKEAEEWLKKALGEIPKDPKDIN